MEVLEQGQVVYPVDDDVLRQSLERWANSKDIAASWVKAYISYPGRTISASLAEEGGDSSNF